MKKTVLLPIFLISTQFLFSQTKTEQKEELINNAREIKMHQTSPSFGGGWGEVSSEGAGGRCIIFHDNYNISHEKALEYSKSFFVSDNVDFRLKNSHINKDGKHFFRYEQTIDGYPVEFSAWHIHVKNNRVTTLNGDIIDAQDFHPVFSITEEQALQAALNYFSAETYMWQDENEEQHLKFIEEDENATYYPKGEKVIVALSKFRVQSSKFKVQSSQPETLNFKPETLNSAFRFNISSKFPYNQKMVYVDAQTGEILFDLPLIYFSNEIGTAHTQYSGIREINTFFDGSSYILRDYTRGNGIITFNTRNGINYDAATNFFDDDNIWNNVNPQLDEYATDAHFATMSTYDYYYHVHGRNSIDNNGLQLRSYVHFNLKGLGYPDNINAFWQYNRMTYGDGDINQGITPLTTVDICAHEITHGLNEKTANLTYSYESGALSEAFSDIFAVAVEFYAVPEYANYTIGEKMGKTVRSIQNPKEFGLPDTYKGQYWLFGSDDNGGVHFNCGPLVYWFYLLCEGGSGVNDNGHAYHVEAIGIEKAEKIAFALLTEYLTPNSQYINAYNYSVTISEELFGRCSAEKKAVTDAFYAIGVITTPYDYSVNADFKVSKSVVCDVPANIIFTNKSVNAKNYFWDFGDGNTSTDINPEHTYTETGIYVVTLSVDEECADETDSKVSYIRVSPSLHCDVIMPINDHIYIEGYGGVIYDSGGPNQNYHNRSNSRLTIYAPEVESIVLEIEEFDIEQGWSGSCNYDYIAFYDGNTIESPLINNTRYCNSTGNPGTISSSGEYITIHFVSDNNNTFAGYKILFHCIGGQLSPEPNFSVNSEISCNGLITFSDESTNIPQMWLWDFGDGKTSYLQNPTHQYIENGTYTVSLTVSNLNGENTIQNEDFLTVEMPESPDIEDIIACNDTDFNIILDLDGTAHWYKKINDKEPFHIGNLWNHPPIEDDLKYFIREATEDNCISLFAELRLIARNCIVSSDFSVNTETSCNGKIIFTDESINMPDEWEWNFGDGKTSSLQNPTHQYSENGIFTVSLTASNQYGANTIQKENFLTVNMPETPEIEDIDACNNMYFNIEIDLEGVAYWFENITANEPIHIGNFWNHAPIEQEIKYFLRETFEQDCISYFTEVLLIPKTCGVSVNQKTLDNIVLYPNPTTGELKVQSFGFKVSEIEIFDVIGRKVQSYEFNVQSYDTLNPKHKTRNNKSEITIDISHLSNGVYFVVIESVTGEKTVFKVIKK